MNAERGQAAEILALLRPFAPWLALSVVTGLAAGAATVALLDTINQVLNRPGGLSGDLLWTFIGLCAVTLVGRAVSDIATNLVGQRLVASVRQSLARKILAAPIDALERYRTHRLMPVLTSDVDMISDVAFVMAGTVIALAITLGCLAYLAWLSPELFGLLLVALVIGCAVQIWAQARGVQGFWEARESEEMLHKAYRAIGDGAKELRLHRERRARVFATQIARTVDRIQDINRRAINTYVFATAFGSALFFLLIALILGWAAWFTLPQPVLSGFVLVLLFLKGPIDQIAGAVPGIGRAAVAFERIADMSLKFTNPEPNVDLSGQGAASRLTDALSLQGVRYAFPRTEGARPFEMGPIDLTVQKGELLFIVGDNGSGKTTLIKLILGLYAPQGGQVVWDGRAVTPETRDDYRQLFTTVFSDFYLFEDLVGAEGREASALLQAAPYLQRLEIDHKVAIENGAFSTLDLSTGQRKRLALVHAYLEGRSVLVFDEWAADQDPAFRHVFYTEILPELRARGHTLIVISHDDRYFHVADRLVRLKDGRILEEEPRVALSA